MMANPVQSRGGHADGRPSHEEFDADAAAASQSFFTTAPNSLLCPFPSALEPVDLTVVSQAPDTRFADAEVTSATSQKVRQTAALPVESSWTPFLHDSVARALAAMGMSKPFPAQLDFLKHFDDKAYPGKVEGLFLRAPHGAGRTMVLLAKAVSIAYEQAIQQAIQQADEDDKVDPDAKAPKSSITGIPYGEYSLRKDSDKIHPLIVIVAPTTMRADQVAHDMKMICKRGFIYVNVQLYHGGGRFRKNWCVGSGKDTGGRQTRSPYREVDIAVCCAGTLRSLLQRGNMSTAMTQLVIFEGGRSLFGNDIEKWDAPRDDVHIKHVIRLMMPDHPKIRAIVSAPCTMSHKVAQQIMSKVFEPFHEAVVKMIAWIGPNGRASNTNLIAVHAQEPLYKDVVQRELGSVLADEHCLHDRTTALLWLLLHLPEIHKRSEAAIPAGEPHAMIVVPRTAQAQRLARLLNMCFDNNVRLVIGAYGQKGIHQDEAKFNLTQFNNAGTGKNIIITTPDIAANGLNLPPNPIVILFQLDGIGGSHVSTSEYIHAIKARCGPAGNKGSFLTIVDTEKEVRDYLSSLVRVMESNGQPIPSFLRDAVDDSPGADLNAIDPQWEVNNTWDTHRDGSDEQDENHGGFEGVEGVEEHQNEKHGGVEEHGQVEGVKDGGVGGLEDHGGFKGVEEHGGVEGEKHVGNGGGEGELG